MEKLTFHIPTSGKRAVLLPAGGKDREGNAYAADNVSLIRNGRRMLPIMGEFHYSRWEPEDWEEELRKIKAGGVEILATYIFWIHHEEKRGEWDFSGRRDIRSFVKLCGKVGLKVWLRIGPWVHAECRNGGFPDWVQHADSFTPRTNDEGYLNAVRNFYSHLGDQLRDLMCRNGGPVIGIQLENEYGHVGGPSDAKIRRGHLQTLLQLAREAGLEAPYYTVTSWGGGGDDLFEEVMPVLGGYVDAPWATTTKPLSASSEFLFETYRNDAAIGTDGISRKMNFAVDLSARYPYLTAELGAGLQVTSHRRPLCSGKDTEAHLVCRLGSGVNLVGYYMYHGGINPDGKYTTLNETQEIGGYTTLPVKSYDFQCCINEAGRLNESYGRLKKYHFLLQDFGEDIAGAEFYYPDILPQSAEDTETIRGACRINRDSGTCWLFLNQHQRMRTMKAHPEVCIEVEYKGRMQQMVPLALENDDCVIVPINLPLEDTLLHSTNASVLCRLGKRTFFYHKDPQKAIFDTESESQYITILSEKEANRAFRLSDGLYVTGHEDSCLIEEADRRYMLTSHESEQLTVYRENGAREMFSVRTEEFKAEPVCWQQVKEERNETGELLYRDYALTVKGTQALGSSVNQIYLTVEYDGDRAEVYQNGKLVDDWYTTGGIWQIRLKRFGYPEELLIRIYDSEHPFPCSFGEDVYYDGRVMPGCCIRYMELNAEYRIPF